MSTKSLLKNFLATKNYKWLAKYAQKRFPKSQLKLKIPTVADLIKGLYVVSQQKLKDQGQEALNGATVRALENYYRNVFDVQDTVWRDLSFTHPDAAFDAFLVPDSSEEIEEFTRLLLDELDNLHLDDKLRDELLDYIQTDKGVTGAIQHVLYKAYFWLYTLFLYRNPVLAITEAESLKKQIQLSPGLTKEAAKAKSAPDRAGPRLSDWREANEFAQGQLMRRIAIADTFGAAPHQNDLIALKASDGMNNYWYNKVAEANAALPTGYRLRSHNVESEDDTHVEMATDDMWVGRLPGETPSKKGKWHTDYLRPSIRVPNKVEIEIPHRDGTAVQLQRVQATVPQLMKFFYDEVKEDENYLGDMLKRSSDHSQSAIDFYGDPAAKSAQVDELGKSVSVEDPEELFRMYEELLINLRANVPTDDGVKSWLASNYPEDYNAMREAGQEQEFYNKYSDQARAYVHEKLKQGKLAAIGIARSVVSDATLFKRWIDTTVRTSLLPVYYFNLDSLSSQNFDPKRAKDITSLYAPAFDLVQARLEAPDYQAKFAKNSRDYNEYYEANKEGAYIVNVRGGLDKLKSESSDSQQFLDTLGLGPDTLRTTSDKYKIKGKEIDAAMKAFAEQYSCEDLSAVSEASGLPVDSIYAYVGQQAVGLLEENLIKRIANKYDGAREKARYAEKGEGADEDEGGGGGGGQRTTEDATAVYAEATTYVNEQLLSLKSSQSVKDSLSIATAPRMVKEWHCNPQLGALHDFDGFTKYFMKNAGDFAFGVFLRDAMDESVRIMFDENKKDPAVTDDNWSDENTPRPRNRRELMEVTGAYADPGRAAKKYDKRLTGLDESIESGQEISGDEMVGLDSAMSHLKRQIFKLGYAVALTGSLIIGTLRDSFDKHAKKLVELDPNHEKNIVRYKKDKHSETNDPFAHQGFVWAKPAVIKLDFDKLDEMTTDDMTALDDILSVTSKEKALEFVQTLSPRMLDPSSKRTLKNMIKGTGDENFTSNETFYKFLATEGIPELDAFHPELETNVEMLLSEMADLLGVILKGEVTKPVPFATPVEDIPLSQERVEVSTSNPMEVFNDEHGELLNDVKTFIGKTDLSAIRRRDTQHLDEVSQQSASYGQQLELALEADLFFDIKKHDPLFVQTAALEEEISALQEKLEEITATISNYLEELQTKTEGVGQIHQKEQERSLYLEGFIGAILETMKAQNYSPGLINGVGQTLGTLTRGTPEQLASPESVAEPYPLVTLLRQVQNNIESSDPASETYVGFGNPAALNDLESYLSEYRSQGSYWPDQEDNNQ